MTTYTITTKPREGGRKLAITVTDSLGQKVTKVTGRTYPYVVVMIHRSTISYNSKTKGMDYGDFLFVNIVKGTAKRDVALKAHADVVVSARPNDAAVTLYRYGNQYGIYKATTNVVADAVV